MSTPADSTGNRAAPPTDHAMVVQSAWLDQALWSATANQLKAGLDRWRRIAAVGGVLGAATSVAAGTLADGPVRQGTAIAAALLLAVVPYVQKTRVSPAQVKAWTRARSASEALKEAIYRFLMGVPPADPPGATEGNGTPAPDPTSAAALVRRCQAIKQRVADLQGQAAQAAPGGSSARPSSLDTEGYLADRVNDQIGWYGRRANQLAGQARRLRQAEFALGLLAVVMGVLSGQSGGAGAELAQQWPLLGTLSPWVGVVTTAGGAVTAHLAATRVEEISAVYFATGQRVQGLRDEWLTDAARDTPERVAAFVDAVERAFAAENQSWLADWTKE
ncbi:DUF4231 domain-containing protein [Ideonella sp. DXS22W]|uniref:DUF4231 domain-containing protein n=1 Tax=Pseudaquabacterium inlustre TaxID=2984192 RepID=A0ABU9CEN1_9BURK